MGTKNQPGKFDCYSKAEPDEPVFVLLGRDPAAPILINLWADIRSRLGEEQEKIEEACACAEACTAWLVLKGKHENFKAAVVTTEEIFQSADRERINDLEAELAALKTKHEALLNEYEKLETDTLEYSK